MIKGDTPAQQREPAVGGTRTPEAGTRELGSHTKRDIGPQALLSQAGGTFDVMVMGAESELDKGVLTHIPGRIEPTAHRGWWIFVGLLLQLVGVGVPAAYVWTKAKHQDVGGLITVATVKLTWHESLHVKTGVEVLAGGAALFAVGSVVLARPFVKHWLTLLVAVPLAALCGALVLGVAALVIAFVVAVAFGGGDLGGSGGSWGSSGKPKPGSEPESDAGASMPDPSDSAV